MTTQASRPGAAFRLALLPRATTATGALRLALTALVIGSCLVHGQARAQAAGTQAVVGMMLPGSAVPVLGWSIKHGLLGRPIVDDRNKQIGTVVDVIVKGGASPYVLVVGVGGRFEFGGHMVAVSLDDVAEQAGLLHLPGASQRSLKAMPRFSYGSTTVLRQQFIDGAAPQLAMANAALSQLRQQAAAESGSVRVRLENDGAALQSAVTRTEDQLADMKKAETARWLLLQKDVQQAIDDMRGAIPPDMAQPVKPALPTAGRH